MTASAVLRQLRGVANAARAAATSRYFRTGPGEYGAGDRFLGLTLPQVRQVTKQYRALPLREVERLLESPWHEARAVAVLILANNYGNADDATRRQIYQLYLRRADRVNNWDLVDASAPAIVGGHLMRRSRAPLRRLAKSKNLWERRIAIVATHPFIRRGEFDDTLRLAVLLKRDPHDLIHKATGWMLREVGKRDERVLRSFLDHYAGELPRTALRYSLERLTPALRRHYMGVPRTPHTGKRA